ncbi:MAG: hypothetical protein A2086_13625 [Spirochaetes bacterium GWD1_27_9]|nr:MAG: hypothetical protein A2Z98_02480 [Spirochaetes bacterium GWB1_27_13]OHD22594.1 MAG: hypothetical protein A2Y34_07445 [Spirochaetes bacterium GWC1_27_15]OHD30699.1 MAG: hypothetical protein A2086_13625 [Spirochaetes bacterium GWD1_27_9]
MRLVLSFFLISLTILGLIFFGCQVQTKEPRTEYVNPSPVQDIPQDIVVDKTLAAFWGLPAISFDGFIPNYHIKATTNGGALEKRGWNFDSSKYSSYNPDTWNIFEYSQILFIKSKYSDLKASDVTFDKSDGKKYISVDEKRLFYEEIKIYKKTPYAPEKFDKITFNNILTQIAETDDKDYIKQFYTYDQTNDCYSLVGGSQVPTIDRSKIKSILEKCGFLDKEISDVNFDNTNDTVEIKLNSASSNYFTLKKGAKIAILATQRPRQWGEVNDYTIYDSFPKANAAINLPNDYLKNTTDVTGDRSESRMISYIVYNGGDGEKTGNNTGDWFESVTLYSDKIVLKMPKLKDGDTAKAYWDKIDKDKDGNNLAVKPFMLFWIAIEQK